MLRNDQALSRCSWFLSGWRDVGVTGYIRSRLTLVSHRRASYHGTVFGNLCGLGWCVYVSTTGLCHWRWERGDRLELVERPCPRCGLTCKSHKNNNNNLVVVQLLSGFSLFATPWTAACQASLSLSVSWSLPKLMSVESVICPTIYPLPSSSPLASVFLSIRAFSKESAVHIRWPWWWQICLLFLKYAGRARCHEGLHILFNFPAILWNWNPGGFGSRDKSLSEGCLTLESPWHCPRRGQPAPGLVTLFKWRVFDVWRVHFWNIGFSLFSLNIVWNKRDSVDSGHILWTAWHSGVWACGWFHVCP